MSFGESIDLRVIEAALNQCPTIVRSCVVGNHFLCAIIEPANDTSNPSTTLLSEITRAIASANRGLAPPLRISWARVLVLKSLSLVRVVPSSARSLKKFSATNLHPSLTVLSMIRRPMSNLPRTLPSLRARPRIKLRALLRISLLRLWGSRRRCCQWKTTLSLPLQKWVLSLCNFIIIIKCSFVMLAYDDCEQAQSSTQHGRFFP